LLGSCEIGDESGVVAAESMKWREIVVKSESLPDMIDEFEEAIDESVLISLIFGAFRALTFVVEINSVGREMRCLLMVPVAYLTLPSRFSVGFSLLKPRLVRFVSARAIEAMAVS